MRLGIEKKQKKNRIRFQIAQSNKNHIDGIRIGGLEFYFGIDGRRVRVSIVRANYL